MESKKSKKANLERKRNIFLEIGLILSLGICLVAFEWSTPEVSSTSLGNLETTTEFEQEVLNTFVEPPKIETIKPDMIIEELIIVDNKTDVESIKFDSDVKEKNDIKIVLTTTTDIPEEIIEIIEFFKVEQKPVFPGGEKAMFQYITSNTKYPDIPKENQIQGKVYVQFVIGVDGSVSNATVLMGVDPYLDAEALRVVNSLPKWEPGKQRGKAVPVSFIIPISFKMY
ncbi:energy transducer TonB [Candidatus Dojkabacteria bacterium]|jgi:protein TonB|nr:energy transducer TonB [Candidatus Dojkabacteria bacterium]